MLGPDYNYADELRAPSEIGVYNGGSPDAIMGAIAGVNYYVDAIGFGHSTSLAKERGLVNQPLGIRYFTKTGSKCSNGADMYEYIDTIPKAATGRISREIQNSLGVKFQGLAPGIMQDAASALNPVPLFNAVIGSGYAQCKQVSLPVGDNNGAIRSPIDGKTWINEPVTMRNNIPYQTRWVYDKDLTESQYNATKKIEGFRSSSNNRIAAGVLFSILVLGLAFSSAK